MHIPESSVHTCAIVIPVYKKEFNYFEKVSLMQCIKIFKGYPLILIAPQSLDTGNYTCLFPFKIERFADESFLSVQSYSRLLLKADFYHRFEDYSDILIHQTDAYVFRNELESWRSRNYDYIGAPVPERPLTDLYKHQVLNEKRREPIFFGNGGLSLRKVDTFIKMLSLENPEIDRLLDLNINEDLINCLLLHKHGKILPDKASAMNFSIDAYPAQAFKACNEKRPFGCHGWYRNDNEYYDAYFWLPKIFPVAGYLCRSFIYRLLLRSSYALLDT